MPLKNQDEDLFEFAEFRGLRNNVGAAGFEPNDLEAAFNVDIDDALFVHRRKGHSAPAVSGACHSLFAKGATCLVVRNNALVQVNPDMSSLTVRTGLAANHPLSYAAVADRIYYSNGVENGVVHAGQHRSWGLTPPPTPTAIAHGGALRSGQYQYAVTYVREDGQESGAGHAGLVELSEIGGFTLELTPSSDLTVTHQRIYVSDTDSETLHLHAEISGAASSYEVIEVRPGGRAIETQFLMPPPAGAHIAYGNGRMLVAGGSKLYPSAPYAPELFDLRKGVPFPDRIALVAPLEDGTWLGTDTEIAWLPNAEPEKWNFQPKASYGVIPGTAAYETAEVIGDGGAKTPAVFFATKQGLCAGMAGGQLVNFTDGRFNYPVQARGAGIVRRHRGIAQYVATLQGAETAGNVAT